MSQGEGKVSQRRWKSEAEEKVIWRKGEGKMRCQKSPLWCRLTYGEEFSKIKPSGHMFDTKCVFSAHIMCMVHTPFKKGLNIFYKKISPLCMLINKPSLSWGSYNDIGANTTTSKLPWDNHETPMNTLATLGCFKKTKVSFWISAKVISHSCMFIREQQQKKLAKFKDSKGFFRWCIM